jgi:GTPase SAR1 family protein
MLKEGSYACYWNRIYLVGPFGVGKTTLAKNLVGDAIPDMYMSTDGIWIYIGRAGMDTEQRKWVFLNEGKFIILIKELSCCLYVLFCIYCRTFYAFSHTSLSPLRRGLAAGFVNYKKRCTRLAAASDKVYQLLAHDR